VSGGGQSLEPGLSDALGELVDHELRGSAEKADDGRDRRCMVSCEASS
jgi:hypothetical protein